MAQEKILLSEDANGNWLARVYDGNMRIFLKQNLKSRKEAAKVVKTFLKTQQEMIESGELLALE